jgi:hypothetical protein
MTPQRRRCFLTAKQIAVKRYVVTLSDEERRRLTTLIGAGKHPARQLTKARILLKADASEAGEGWSDSQIAAALDTSIDTVARTSRQLVEEGFEDVLTRKHSPASARPRIFDGATEAKLIALACSALPQQTLGGRPDLSESNRMRPCSRMREPRITIYRIPGTGSRVRLPDML